MTDDVKGVEEPVPAEQSTEKPADEGGDAKPSEAEGEEPKTAGKSAAKRGRKTKSDASTPAAATPASEGRARRERKQVRTVGSR